MNQNSKTELRAHLRDHLDETILEVNDALRGNNLDSLEPTLERLGRGGTLPHWYSQLYEESTLPNLDGKTIGSIIEMLLVAILETKTFAGFSLPPLRVNPARGVDIPDLNLGVKSPSENFCTSEPFFSAYERLHGSDHDAIILLTDYQTAKKKPPLRLQIIKWTYLRNTEIADKKLCSIARKHRSWVLSKDEAWLKKLFRFLAYVNQSDWSARALLKLVASLENDTQIAKLLADTTQDYERTNRKLISKGDSVIPRSDLESIQAIGEINPPWVGVIDVADNWVVNTYKDFGRTPNENEWGRLVDGPLDGKIGMSYALQWRYNFKSVFDNLRKVTR